MVSERNIVPKHVFARIRPICDPFSLHSSPSCLLEISEIVWRSMSTGCEGVRNDGTSWHVTDLPVTRGLFLCRVHRLTMRKKLQQCTNHFKLVRWGFFSFYPTRVCIWVTNRLWDPLFSLRKAPKHLAFGRPLLRKISFVRAFMVLDNAWNETALRVKTTLATIGFVRWLLTHCVFHWRVLDSNWICTNRDVTGLLSCPFFFLLPPLQTNLFLTSTTLEWNKRHVRCDKPRSRKSLKWYIDRIFKSSVLKALEKERALTHNWMKEIEPDHLWPHGWSKRSPLTPTWSIWSKKETRHSLTTQEISANWAHKELGPSNNGLLRISMQALGFFPFSLSFNTIIRNWMMMTMMTRTTKQSFYRLGSPGNSRFLPLHLPRYFHTKPVSGRYNETRDNLRTLDIASNIQSKWKYLKAERSVRKDYIRSIMARVPLMDPDQLSLAPPLTLR